VPAQPASSHARLMNKKRLALHLGQEHIVMGASRATIWPPLKEREKWRRDELDAEHRALHGEDR
jgi:hypothetical protein